MTCKECISFDVCSKDHRKHFATECNAEYVCKHFTDKDLINCQKTEIENLKDLVKRIRRNALMIRNINCETAKKIKSETVKEFAKFCIDKSNDWVISVCDIADYAIEMVDE